MRRRAVYATELHRCPHDRRPRGRRGNPDASRQEAMALPPGAEAPSAGAGCPRFARFACAFGAPAPALGGSPPEEEHMTSPRSCPDCLRRSWLLALLGPYIEKLATSELGSRSPELLRLSNEDLVAVAA